MSEIWKDVPNYERLYQVSNQGNVKSLSFGARNIKHSNVERLLSCSMSNLGYRKVELYKNGKSKMFYVHRLVANSFIPNPDNKPQVNHKDGNKSNNRVENLEWVSAKENISHAISTGLKTNSPMLGRKGVLNPQSKSISRYDLQGNYIESFVGISETARYLGISCSALSNCLCGRKKTCCGSIWRYADRPLNFDESTISP